MKKFGVCVPIAGYVYKEIEEDTEEEAIDKAFDEGYTDDEIQELDMYGKSIDCEKKGGTI